MVEDKFNYDLGDKFDFDSKEIVKPKESLKSKLGRVAVGGAFVMGCGAVAFGLVSASYKSEHIPLTERLEKAYKTCQEIEDKSQEVEFAPFVYSSCQEVENLYNLVNKSDSVKTKSHERRFPTRIL